MTYLTLFAEGLFDPDFIGIIDVAIPPFIHGLICALIPATIGLTASFISVLRLQREEFHDLSRMESRPLYMLHYHLTPTLITLGLYLLALHLIGIAWTSLLTLFLWLVFFQGSNRLIGAGRYEPRELPPLLAPKNKQNPHP